MSREIFTVYLCFVKRLLKDTQEKHKEQKTRIKAKKDDFFIKFFKKMVRF